MTQYLMSVWHHEDDAPPADEETQEMYAAVGAYNERLRERGSWVFAGGSTHRAPPPWSTAPAPTW
ncbi:MAG: hypothetical protein ABIU87_13850 [Ornithinibacter sp.]